MKISPVVIIAIFLIISSYVSASVTQVFEEEQAKLDSWRLLTSDIHYIEPKLKQEIGQRKAYDPKNLDALLKEASEIEIKAKKIQNDGSALAKKEDSYSRLDGARQSNEASRILGRKMLNDARHLMESAELLRTAVTTVTDIYREISMNPDKYAEIDITNSSGTRIKVKKLHETDNLILIQRDDGRFFFLNRKSVTIDRLIGDTAKRDALTPSQPDRQKPEIETPYIVAEIVTPPKTEYKNPDFPWDAPQELHDLSERFYTVFLNASKASGDHRLKLLNDAEKLLPEIDAAFSLARRSVKNRPPAFFDDLMREVRSISRNASHPKYSIQTSAHRMLIEVLSDGYNFWHLTPENSPADWQNLMEAMWSGGHGFYFTKDQRAGGLNISCLFGELFQISQGFRTGGRDGSYDQADLVQFNKIVFDALKIKESDIKKTSSSEVAVVFAGDTLFTYSLTAWRDTIDLTVSVTSIQRQLDVLYPGIATAFDGVRRPTHPDRLRWIEGPILSISSWIQDIQARRDNLKIGTVIDYPHTSPKDTGFGIYHMNFAPENILKRTELEFLFFVERDMARRLAAAVGFQGVIRNAERFKLDVTIIPLNNGDEILRYIKEVGKPHGDKIFYSVGTIIEPPKPKPTF